MATNSTSVAYLTFKTHFQTYSTFAKETIMNSSRMSCPFKSETKLINNNRRHERSPKSVKPGRNILTPNKKDNVIKQLDVKA